MEEKIQCKHTNIDLNMVKKQSTWSQMMKHWCVVRNWKSSPDFLFYLCEIGNRLEGLVKGKSYGKGIQERKGLEKYSMTARE